MHPSVVALLVSHDGARWLPAVIEGLQAQTVPLSGVVCVDTASRDESADLLLEAFDEVVTPGSRTSYPEAVQIGLEQIAADDAEWIWLVHDDANPAPDALAKLLAAAADDPAADILGPKLREWPSLKRLLEVGVTISGTGRRETGLERGEYDQGQHDDTHTVLAVNTAGMLVRRRVLDELGGFDPDLPIFGNDIDFGWRAAAAGHKTVVVPQAIVFHAEAAHKGLRRTPLTGRHAHYQQRRAALFTLLANCPSRQLPWQVVRLFFGTLVRMVGFLVVRSAGEAMDELAALLSVYFSPGEIRRARGSRIHGADQHDVRPLLAPVWLPYRHGLDFLSDIFSALTNQAQDVADRRRVASEAAAPAPIKRPAVRDEDAPEEDTGLVARFLTNPLAIAMAVFVVLAVLGAREAFGSVSGGGLAPAPATANDLWHLWGQSWHPLGEGTPVPAPAYVVPVAVLGSLLGNSASAAVSALLVLAVPLSMWGAWRFLRVVGRLVDPAGSPRWLVALGAATYGLVPVASGAWGSGRLGVVATSILLPWLARAALGFADPESDRRWRAAWRSGLLLALVVGFTPVAWVFTVVLAVVLIVIAYAVTRALPGRSVWGPPTIALLSPVVLLSPWWLPALQHGAGSLLLMETGRQPYPAYGFSDLVTGRLDGVGAPWWVGTLLVVLAALALIPHATRIPVLVTWLVATAAALTAAFLGAFLLPLPGGSVRPGLAFFLVLLRACWVVGALLGAQGLVTLLRRSGRESQELLLVGLAVVAAIVPVVGLGWFVVKGPGDLADTTDTGIPAYMTQSALAAKANGILVIRGDVATGLSYTVRRGAGDTLGENEIQYATTPDAGFATDVRALVSRPTPTVVDDLAGSGIQYVVLPSPADPDVAAGLDATDGLVQASAENRSARAWSIGSPVDPHAVDGTRSVVRIGLLVLQGIAALVIIVLCLPTWRAPRKEPA